MTVYTTKPAINLREELASLRNQGGYSEQQFYFDGLVTNGTFDTNTTGWTDYLATTSVTSGEVETTNTGSAGGLYQDITTVVGGSYTTMVVARCGTATAVDLRVYDGGGFSTLIDSDTSASTSNVTFTISFVAVSSSTRIYLRGAGTGFTAYFDNISVFNTDGTDVIHTMPKGWKPKDVFEDGLLQREGAANDYTVVYDGFDYVVKPTVAPSATTQTCVIGVRA